MHAVVEDSYDGPRLETDASGAPLVTPAFLDALIERFKDQKLLHSKYTVMLLLAVLKQFQAMPNIVSIKTGEIPVRACPGSMATVVVIDWL